MSNESIPDIMKTEAALRRAGMKALWLGKRMGTPVVVWRNGKIVDAAKTDPEPDPATVREFGRYDEKE
jgi:hypothetical protein